MVAGAESRPLALVVVDDRLGGVDALAGAVADGLAGRWRVEVLRIGARPAAMSARERAAYETDSPALDPIVAEHGRMLGDASALIVVFPTVANGLSAPVTVARDALGVATVEAANEADAARALGFLHGQERYFEMDLLRRSAAGELSALFGPLATMTPESGNPWRSAPRSNILTSSSWARSRSDRPTRVPAPSSNKPRNASLAISAQRMINETSS
jgi:hypothetical protein